MRLGITASIIGVAITLALLTSAFLADAAGHPDVSRALFWQNELLQRYVSGGNIGTADQLAYEGSPLNFLAFLVSIPLGFVIYGSIAYFALKRRTRAI